MSNHTPGPWFVHDFSGVTPNEPPKPMDVSVSCTTPDHLEVVYMGKALCNSYEEALANARLIAAAPEMLEALKIAYQFLDGYKPPFTVKDKLRAIVKKAEGQEEKE